MSVLLARHRPTRNEWGLGSIDKVFEDLFARPLIQERETSDFSPRVDVTESEGAFVATLEIPGVDEEKLDISLDENILTVSGEKHSEVQHDEDTVIHLERRYGTFKRSIKLASEIDQEKVTANYKNGVLEITLPKIPEAEPKVHKIKIQK